MENRTVSLESCARIPTAYGEFQLCLFRNTIDDKEHLAFVAGDVSGRENVLVRVHSECFTGDVLGSQRCDCGEQLERSLEIIGELGQGVIVYMRQEGRGIGLAEKLKAYNLQDVGHDTVDANLILGHQADARDYTVAALILRHLDVRSVRLLTNNPAKINDLRDHGIDVIDRIPLQPRVVNDNNRNYLMTKIKRMDHLMTIDQPLVGGGAFGRTVSG
jgi:GTP cyclohydrolase II